MLCDLERVYMVGVYFWGEWFVESGNGFGDYCYCCVSFFCIVVSLGREKRVVYNFFFLIWEFESVIYVVGICWFFFKIGGWVVNFIIYGVFINIF